MIDYREIIRLKSAGCSDSKAAASLGSARETVAKVWALARKNNLKWPLDPALSNPEIRRILFPDKVKKEDLRLIPDYDYLHQELAKPGVKLSLLYSEYCEQARLESKIPYQQTQFYDLYSANISKTKATLRIARKPGDIMEVDWPGDTLTVIDSLSGEKLPAYLFVACLDCSLYGYAEAFPDMKLDHWIEGHIHAYEFFGGSTRILVPDNLRTGVTKHTSLELITNRTYHDMAEHYDTAIIPARVKAPDDKPNAEGSVNVMETWIIAALRNRQFFSFEELNRAVSEKLAEFNSRPFAKRKGSRQSAFTEEEREFLQPLPASRFEMAVWSKAKIQPDYLIQVGNCKYSVPYEYIGKTVDIRTSDKTIEVFYQSNRIALHVKKEYSREPIYIPEHMPENHRKYLSYNAEYFKEWSGGIGPAAHNVVIYFLTSHKDEREGYAACVKLTKLAEKYSPERLENACGRALSYTPQPSLKNINTILRNGFDKVKTETHEYDNGSEYGIVRGDSYWNGGDR